MCCDSLNKDYATPIQWINSCGPTRYIIETAGNLEVRVKGHSDVSKQSVLAKHIKDNSNHTFSWGVLATAYSALG